jgi:hypothetical protein
LRLLVRYAVAIVVETVADLSGRSSAASTLETPADAVLFSKQASAKWFTITANFDAVGKAVPARAGIAFVNQSVTVVIGAVAYF